MAVGSFPVGDISTVLRRRETRTKITVPASLMHLTADDVIKQRDLDLLGRTVVPLRWFMPGDGAGRRWCWPLRMDVCK